MLTLPKSHVQMHHMTVLLPSGGQNELVVLKRLTDFLIFEMLLFLSLTISTFVLLAITFTMVRTLSIDLVEISHSSLKVLSMTSTLTHS